MKVLLDIGISPRLRSALQQALGGATVESGSSTTGVRCETASCWTKPIDMGLRHWSRPTSVWRRNRRDSRLRWSPSMTIVSNRYGPP